MSDIKQGIWNIKYIFGVGTISPIRNWHSTRHIPIKCVCECVIFLFDTLFMTKCCSECDVASQQLYAAVLDVASYATHTRFCTQNQLCNIISCISYLYILMNLKYTTTIFFVYQLLTSYIFTWYFRNRFSPLTTTTNDTCLIKVNVNYTCLDQQRDKKGDCFTRKFAGYSTLIIRFISEFNHVASRPPFSWCVVYDHIYVKRLNS